MHRIYLAGPISGGTFKYADGWRVEVAERLKAVGYAIASPTARERIIFDGTDHVIHPKEGTEQFQRELVYRDDYDIINSNILFANFCDETDGSVSIGTVGELNAAWHINKYCVVAVEDNSIHDHPFITARAHFRAYSREEAVQYLETLARTHNG